MMGLEAKVREMDEMLSQALGVVSDLLGTVKEMRAAEESHRCQTQAALKTAASERSSLASAIERVRHGFETPDARELCSKIENLGSRIAIVGGDYQKMREELADVREELAAVDNAQMQAARGLTEDDGEQRERLEALEDRMEKVEAAPAVGPFLIPYDGASGERQWKQLDPSDIPYDTGTPIRKMGSWVAGPTWVGPNTFTMDGTPIWLTPDYYNSGNTITDGD